MGNVHVVIILEVEEYMGGMYEIGGSGGGGRVTVVPSK